LEVEAVSVSYNKCPFPWFGGKQHAAPTIWAALGDVPHYVEPFAGSLAALLCRPSPPNRPYFSETVNDIDGMLVNAWRAIALSPDETAEWASWPVSEADLMARHLWLVELKGREDFVGRLRADPDWHDPRAAGYWMWGQSSWIGSGWCTGKGPWRVDESGVVVKQGRGKTRAPGVDGNRPHIGNNGQGVNHAGTRAPGAAPDESRDWHPMTMPELREWMRFLSARLRHVRILCGDWKRAVTTGAAWTLPVRSGKGPAGVFLDPPYSGEVRDKDLYAHDSGDVATAVREWCAANGGDPKFRVVLAGFAGEGHETLVTEHGWREVEWYAGGFLRGGMGNTGKKGGQQKRERLWLSPHCRSET
jgi:hypothetical protein